MTTPKRFILTLSLGSGLFFAGYLLNRHEAGPPTAASARQVLYYTCPMHPQYKSDHPGDAPCCGMRLVPVPAAGPAAAPNASGTARLATARQQLIGVRTSEVKRESASHVLRVPGRIAVDESRLYRLIAAADGWIRSIGRNTAGTFVKRNQILASYYAANFVPAQQAFMFALSTLDQLQKGDVLVAGQRPPTNINLQVATDTLRALGMSDIQIKEIEETQRYASDIHVYSPANGFVVSRNVSPAQRFDKGTELYSIADISRVWVLADIFEKDREFVPPGSMAIVRYQGRGLHARMSDVLPQFDPQSRTVKTRFEVDNPDFLLRPGVFVDVEIELNMPEALTVPADAVLDTGRRKTVFVECGDGCFEPRFVETGWQLGDHVQIVHGLEPGERIVVSGAFLIDSESRMHLAAASAAGPPPKNTSTVDPVCGMDVDPKAPGAIRSEHDGATYYFCSANCKKNFEANTGKYAAKKMSAQGAAGARGPA